MILLTIDKKTLAIVAIQAALKMYLMKSSNDNSEALKSLAGIEQALVANEMQSSITSYFTV